MGSDRIGYEEVHGGHGVGAPNEDGIKVLDFATAYQMRILNTSYQKRKNKNKNKKFIVDPNTNSYIIQIHQINQ